ncbi:probable E3 ubiquitin-protein ligase ARI1 [Punica granatum]|uniref:RBR-type E3 ubiquitin transferase n=1 Tax=Punica granatum TaxID=22663 RepID=A0A6P8DFC2_PUNGR|nr:probable E3 ubiquitin-protein ligase ARI1 [Punica granatum]
MDANNKGCYDRDPHNDDEKPPDRGWVVPPKTKNPFVQMITQESLRDAQQEDLCRVMELLSVKENEARTALVHYWWDVKKVSAVLLEKGASNLFAEAGVSIPEEDQASNNTPTLEPVIRCRICFMPKSHMTRMNCGHCFCNKCKKLSLSRRIKCMAHRCNSICDESIIRNLVGEQDVNLAEKFERFLFESYIEENKMVKWCPSIPPCGYALQIKDEDDLICEVECRCGRQFCFGCLLEPHSPCTCLMWEMWAKSRDELETDNWLNMNTKRCPVCHKCIQKDGGCNSMYCPCGNKFSWLHAIATGKEHTGTAVANHSICCGRKENEERYTYCYASYMGHMESLKLEMKLKDRIERKLSTWKGALVEERLKSGLHMLSIARRFLSHSYVLAFYMFWDKFRNEMSKEERKSRKKIFEDKQQQLEDHVERLSGLLNKPFEVSMDDPYSTQVSIIYQSIATDSLCRNMYDFIKNDLLGSLRSGPLRIAPYRSEGPVRAILLGAVTTEDSHSDNQHC